MLDAPSFNQEPTERTHVLRRGSGTMDNSRFRPKKNAIEVATTSANKYGAFFVADTSKGRPEGFADEVDFWFEAYVENSAGKTTQSVRF